MIWSLSAWLCNCEDFFSSLSLKQNSLSNVNFLKQNNHFKIRHGSREPSPFYLSWRAIFELISESLEKVYFMVQMPFRRLATLKRHLLDKPYNHLSGCAGRVAPSNGHSSNYCNYFCIKCAWWNKKRMASKRHLKNCFAVKKIQSIQLEAIIPWCQARQYLTIFPFLS